MTENDEILTTKEAAKLLKVSEEAMRRLLREGEIPGAFAGTREGWRVKRSDVMSWTTNQPKESTMTYHELVALQAEAVRRLPLNPHWRGVGGVQDGYFNLTSVGSDMPLRIRTRDDLDFYMPNR